MTVLHDRVDYGISRAIYSGGMLLRVEVRRAAGEAMLDREVWGRGTLLAAMAAGRRFCTMESVPAGGWKRLREVRIVEVRGVPYLRVDAEEREEDDLGGLGGL